MLEMKFHIQWKQIQNQCTKIYRFVNGQKFVDFYWNSILMFLYKQTLSLDE